MKKIKIQNKIIDVDRQHCIDISSTIIEFCNSKLTGDKTTYNKGVELTNTEFDTLKLWLETNLGEHTII